MSTPATDLLKALSAGLADGTFSRDEAQEVLEVCAELMEALADQHVKHWWGKLVLNAAAAAIRKAADEIKTSHGDD
jgi:hypothetical protein